MKTRQTLINNIINCDKEVNNDMIKSQCSSYHKKHTDEYKKKMSEKLKGRVFSEEHKRNLSKSGKGKKISEEQKKKISEKLKGRLFSDEYKKKMSEKLKGKVFSEEHKRNLSKSGKGKRKSIETRLKISISHSGKKRKSLSKEHKQKISISRKKYEEKNGHAGTVLEGLNEKFILDTISNNSNQPLLRNNSTISKKIKGKVIDGYSVQYNLSIEILEPYHFTILNELKKYDKERELIIASNLCCMIYYISEQQFLNNPEKEINRFINFLVLLDQGAN